VTPAPAGSDVGASEGALVGTPITVLGAGIGGLTAALALARHGARVRVLEQAPAIREVGAGLQISPNGMAVLEVLGLGPELRQGAVAAQGVVLADGRSGRQVLRMGLHTLRSRHPWLLVHRADLIAALAAAAEAAGVRVELGRRVDDVAVEAHGVRLELGDGTAERHGLVVAADGVRSVARAAMGETDAPRFTGQVAWRALAPQRHVAPPEVRVFTGPGRHLVAYPLRDGRLMNLVAVQERAEWTAPDWRQPDDPARMRAAFADFAEPARGLLEGIEDVHVWGLFRTPVARHWHRGGLVGLGDAVHPTLPFLAQGACMAIEDAWVLADALAISATDAAAFRLYQNLRRGRCARIVAAANANAVAYHLRGPARWLGNAALRTMDRLSPDSMLKRFDWLYGHDVTRL